MSSGDSLVFPTSRALRREALRAGCMEYPIHWQIPISLLQAGEGRGGGELPYGDRADHELGHRDVMRS